MHYVIRLLDYFLWCEVTASARHICWYISCTSTRGLIKGVHQRDKGSHQGCTSKRERFHQGCTSKGQGLINGLIFLLRSDGDKLIASAIPECPRGEKEQACVRASVGSEVEVGARVSGAGAGRTVVAEGPGSVSTTRRMQQH